MYKIKRLHDYCGETRIAQRPERQRKILRDSSSCIRLKDGRKTRPLGRTQRDYPTAKRKWGRSRNADSFSTFMLRRGSARGVQRCVCFAAMKNRNKWAHVVREETIKRAMYHGASRNARNTNICLTLDLGGKNQTNQTLFSYVLSCGLKACSKLT